MAKASLLTVLAMLAFAGNSILCRLALRDEAIDPLGFTAIRMISGAIMLVALYAVKNGPPKLRRHGSWASALMLFVYAIAFSFAYVFLDAGSGALILFGFVQATMLVASLKFGDRPGILEWAGWFLACVGLVWLLLPGAQTPSLPGVILMATAGIAWGLYSLRGQQETNPLGATTTNFTYCVIFAGGALILANPDALSVRGTLLATVSGAITSGLGYVLWYAALNYLSTLQAALVQLSVPVVTALGGIVLLAEPLSLRLVVASMLVLGGILLALQNKAPG